MNRQNVALGILILVAVVTVFLVAYETIHGDPVPTVIQNLLAVVLGFLGANLSSAQGAEQALASPTTPAPAAPTPVASPIAPQPEIPVVPRG